MLLQLIVAATQSPGTQTQLLLCAARIAAAGEAAGLCEGLLQVALTLLEVRTIRNWVPLDWPRSLPPVPCAP